MINSAPQAFPPRPRRLNHIVLALIVACVALASTLPATAADSTANSEHKALNVAVFNRVWDTVRRSYYDEDFHGIDWTKQRERYRPVAADAADTDELYAVINTMLDQLDDNHTHALSPRETNVRRKRRGVVLGLRLSEIPDTHGHVVVTDVMPGGAAHEAGVKPGWILVTADGRRPDEILGADKLVEGRTVTCEFIGSNDETLILPLTARRLTLTPVLEKQHLEDGIVYLRFDRFESASARWVRQQLREHHDAPGVIVDLRHNPGGDSAALGRTLGEFFRERVDMGTFITRSGRLNGLRAWIWLGSARFRGPVAVLVSDDSASSAEIFAAVMKHHDRAVVVGEKTSGVVLAARFRRLPDGGELEYSVLDYIAPDGHRLEGNGVAAEIEVERSRADLRAGTDPVLDAAVHALKTR